jgi:hypothetical protein
MTTEMIEKFVEKKIHQDNIVGIHFKERSTVKGLFIKLNDYKELKSKNLWRVVNSIHVDEWRKTKDTNLARIFNGVSFTRLTEEQ